MAGHPRDVAGRARFLRPPSVGSNSSKGGAGRAGKITDPVFFFVSLRDLRMGTSSYLRPHFFHDLYLEFFLGGGGGLFWAIGRTKWIWVGK